MNISRLIHSLFLSLLIVLQSCTIYKSQPLTLDEAVEANSKSKVFYKDNSKMSYNKLTKEDGNYYGYFKKQWYSKNKKFPIEENLVDYVKTNNKAGSAVATGVYIGTGTILAYLLIVLVGAGVLLFLAGGG